MDDRAMRRRIDAVFEFIDRVRKHPERYPDEAVLFLLEPAEVASAFTKEPLRILRELQREEYPSIMALARALGRDDVSRVRKDLVVLERLDLVSFSKSGNRIRATPMATGIYIPLWTPERRSPASRRSAIRSS